MLLKIDIFFFDVNPIAELIVGNFKFLYLVGSSHCFFKTHDNRMYQKQPLTKTPRVNAPALTLKIEG